MTPGRPSTSYDEAQSETGGVHRKRRRVNCRDAGVQPRRPPENPKPQKNMDVKAKVQDWVNLQAAMKAAGSAGNTHDEQRFCDAATEIERQLQDAGHDIRDFVCP